MALIPGTRLGVYEVTAPIGEGGMGQVYRATDTTLGRQVAIKILPDAFAADPERLARFEREAKTLASLNHPHIAAIYAVEKSAGMHALVMELVEGEDLSQRIARGAIPLDEALPIAQQIAEALEAAHEQGIIHRDLKPANIKVRDDGTVKVLDFGLAKAMEQGSGIGDRGSVDATHSPTITTPAHLREGYGGQAMTQAGMILGTAAYMAPEQAKGKTADKRADIWAFGCVLYEMLSGRPPFTGETVSETLADVMKSEPTWKALPASLPGNLSTVIRRCLVKDPRQRIRDVGDVRLALEGAFELPSAPATPAVAPIVSRTRERIAWAALGVVSLAALAVAAFAFLGQAPADVRPTRFFVSPPDGWRVTTATGPTGASPGPLAVSPDGSRIAFLANTATGSSRLWVRALDTLTAQELPGTDGASSPFWSPDSRSLGFFADGKLKKIEVSGGPAITLCATPEFRGGAWSRDGVIVFNSTGALQKVSASGGVPSAATVLGEGETIHTRPSFLPDGRHFLYRVGNGGLYVTSLDSTARTLLIKNPDGSNVVYSRGHLLFLRETTLMAQPFDLGQLTLTGEPVPIAEQIQATGILRNGLFSASDTGVLVYQTGIATADRQLTWFDRTGRLLGSVGQPGLYGNVAFSPDGTRVAFDRDEPPAAKGTDDLWVHEFARSTSTRLTFDPADDWMAVWSPDGNRIVWGTTRDEKTSNVYRKGSNNTGADEVLLRSSDQKYPYDWSPDGRFLLYAAVPPGGRSELWVLPLTGDDRKPAPYLQTAFNTGHARFSPDGRYVAYASNASGRPEVYVQPFPAPGGGKWQVSQGGGNQPRWRRDGKELFYISADSKVMAVPVATTPAFTPGVPTALFAAPIWGGITTINSTRYDVTADGQKFLINVLPPETTAAPPAPITVVLNWTAGLKP